MEVTIGRINRGDSIPETQTSPIKNFNGKHTVATIALGFMIINSGLVSPIKPIPKMDVTEPFVIPPKVMFKNGINMDLPTVTIGTSWINPAYVILETLDMQKISKEENVVLETLLKKREAFENTAKAFGAIIAGAVLFPSILNIVPFGATIPAAVLSLSLTVAMMWRKRQRGA